jgi:hypothetical protein
VGLQLAAFPPESPFLHLLRNITVEVSVLLAPPTIPDPSGHYIRISIEVTFSALSIEK